MTEYDDTAYSRKTTSEYASALDAALARAEAAERDAAEWKENAWDHAKRAVDAEATLTAVREWAENREHYCPCQDSILAILNGEAQATERKPGPLHG